MLKRTIGIVEGQKLLNFLFVALFGLTLNFPPIVSADHAGEPPGISRSNVLIRSDPQGRVRVSPTVTVTDPDGIDTLSVTVRRPSVFGPFDLSTSRFLGQNDSDTRDNFRNFFDASVIPEGDRAGEYEFTVTDEDGHSISISDFLPTGLTPLLPGGPVTVDSATGSLTPTVVGVTVPGATHYRLLFLDDTDTMQFAFDNVPGPTMGTEPFFVVTPGVLEPGKSYRIRMDAFDESTRWGAHLFSHGPFERYNPVAPETPEELALSVGTLDLVDGVINSLTSKLRAAQKSSDKGNRRAQAKQLKGFLRHIQALERSGRLDSRAANALIAAAEGIIAGDDDGGGDDGGGR